MANPVWPVTLPDRLIAEGYTESPPNTTLRTAMDAGADKVRRRYTAGPRPFKGFVILTLAEKQSLDDFYVSTTFSGSIAFEWRHPSKAAYELALIRFVTEPVFSEAGPDCWRADLDLEVKA